MRSCDVAVLGLGLMGSAALDAHRASAHYRRYAIQGLYQLLRERASENLSALI